MPFLPDQKPIGGAARAKGPVAECSKNRPPPKGNKPLPTDRTTDHTRWRLKDVKGRQTWHYLTEEEAKEWPQTFADKYFLNLPLVSEVNL